MEKSSGARRPDVAAVELVGGAEPLQVELHSYDERWVGLYQDHRNQILTALGAVNAGHRLVRTPTRDVHVHIYGRGDPAVDEYLLLRDWLRCNADDLALYESTKRSLLRSRWDDMNAYADAKTDVILAIKARARAVCTP